jgi:hypothetical protein
VTIFTISASDGSWPTFALNNVSGSASVKPLTHQTLWRTYRATYDPPAPERMICTKFAQHLRVIDNAGTLAQQLCDPLRQHSAKQCRHVFTCRAPRQNTAVFAMNSASMSSTQLDHFCELLRRSRRTFVENNQSQYCAN